MALGITWTRTAKEQLERIHDFYARHAGPDTADELIMDILDFAEKLGTAKADGIDVTERIIGDEPFLSVQRDDVTLIFRHAENGPLVIYAVWKPE